MLVGAQDGGGTSGGINGIVSDRVGNDGIFVGAWDGGGTSGGIDGIVSDCVGNDGIFVW